MPEKPPPVTLVNVFEGAPDQDDDLIRDWERARDYLRSQPGLITTTLHRRLAADADFRFVNVAVGECPEASQAASTSPAFQTAEQVTFC